MKSNSITEIKYDKVKKVYICCKVVTLPNSVGIVPVNELPHSSLF